jgi:hypothetical protein
MRSRFWDRLGIVGLLVLLLFSGLAFAAQSYQKRAFTGVVVFAKDDKLVGASAGSCTWTRTFFDTLSPGEWAQYDREYDAYRKAQLAALTAQSQP